MKHVTTLLFVALSMGLFGQDLPAVPATEPSVELRLELAGWEMDRAAEWRSLATFMIASGAGIIAADRINNRDGSWSFAAGVAVFSFGTYVTLNSMGDRHDRRAARLLHGQ